MTLSPVTRVGLGLALCVVIALAWGMARPVFGAAKEIDTFTSTFDVQKEELAASGRSAT